MVIMDKPKELQNLATRQYIDQTVAPTLLQALSKLSKERPANPLLFLGNFFLEKARLAEEAAPVADSEAPITNSTT